jgi:hypothetical protein
MSESRIEELGNSLPASHSNWSRDSINCHVPKDKYLDILERQIQALDQNQSQEACLRYEAEAFMLRKKRT